MNSNSNSNAANSSDDATELDEIELETLISAIDSKDESYAISILNEFPNLAKTSRRETLKTPLFHSSKADLTNVSKRLIELGANPNAEDFFKNSPLHDACGQSVEILLKHGTKESKDLYGLTQLHAALNDKDYGKAEILIQNGFKIDAKDNVGLAPLHYAAAVCDTEESTKIIDMLVAAGADVNAEENSKQTPLHYSDSPYSMRALIRVGATEKKDSRGASQLHSAIAFSKTCELAGILLEAGFDPNSANLSGDSALHIAAQLSKIESIQTLVSAGADPASVNQEGFSPPMSAISKGTWEAFKTFIDLNVAIDYDEAAQKASVFNLRMLESYLLNNSLNEKTRNQNDAIKGRKHPKNKI